jgi:hypothetical protein
MKQFKNFFLIALMVLVGGLVSSCGSDDDNNGGGGSGLGTYTLKCHISDYGTIPTEFAKIMNDALEQNVNQQYPNVSLDLVKKAVDQAVEDAVKSGQYNDSPYNYTIEFYIVDSNGKKVYSRYIIVKNGTATAA